MLNSSTLEHTKSDTGQQQKAPGNDLAL